MTLVLIPQRDGGPLQWENCFAASGAMGVAMETAGAKRPTGSQFRANVMELDKAGHPVRRDVTGGGSPSQIVETARRAYGVTLDYALMDFEEAYALGGRDDVALLWSVSYAPVSGTRFDGSPGFRGLHGIVRSGGLELDPLADGRRAGIPSGPQAWPKDLLRRASEGYTKRPGKAAVIIARAPAVKPTTYSVQFEPGAVFLYSQAVGGKWIRKVDPGVKRRSFAPCTAPSPKPWLDGQKRLVLMTAGKYRGRWVEPTATHLQLVEHR